MTQSVAVDDSRKQPSTVTDWLFPLLEHRRQLVVTPIVTAILVVAVTLLLPKKYTTTASFVPVQSDAAGGALAGLAGQIGIALPTADMSATPDFYAQLLRTDALLLALLREKYEVEVDGEKVPRTFVELYEIDEGDSGKTLHKAIEVLSTKVLTVGFDRQTSIVTVDVRTKWRDLSYQMAQHLIAQVDSFNLQSRQGRASSEEKFLRLRLDTAKSELRAAENSLQRFLLANRTYQSDPVLAFEAGRLERELMLRQSVYSTLIQSYEAARLAAVRNTPSIDLVERPGLALRFDRRRTVTKAALGFALGLLLALVRISLITSFRDLEQASPAQAMRLRQLLGDSWSDLKTLHRRGRRHTGESSS